MIKTSSDKRDKQIEEYLKTPLQVGEYVYVFTKALSSLNRDTREYMKIESLDPLTVTGSGYHNPIQITIDDIYKRCTHRIGADPFDKKSNSIRPLSFTLYSVVHALNLIGDHNDAYNINGIPLMELNWNPYIYDEDGNKKYYQRDFVWTLENKQNLVESIYNHVDCGKILVRVFEWDELEVKASTGETNLAFHDIVDGKQRLKTIQEFLLGEFSDKHGNYYGDLSIIAQKNFLDHALFSYSEMKNVTDKEVLTQFLKLNFTGIPQSTEHLNYVRSLID